MLLGALLTGFVFETCLADWQTSAEVSRLFNNAGVAGTFVLHDPATGQNTGYNRERAAQRFVPASTFKIPHSLIGLSVGAVASVDEVLPYGGEPQPFAAWEKDMGLREAIAMSNVPIYRALARRIGIDRMRGHVAKLEYGNATIGDVVDTFWLNGPLQISAIEQTVFLARLAQGELPVLEPIQASVREIVLLEQRDDFALYGKTGWENAPNAGVGWWVGWVRQRDRIYSFALNMEMRQASDGELRLTLGRASLAALGVLQ